MLDPGLYVVATPIGNREDISLRALRVLADAHCVAAEDTRHSGALLRHHGIEAKLVSLHEHNEEQRIPGLLELIREGQAVALISDAGTPLISDPGYRLVRAVAEAGLPVHPVPGASAVTAALSVCALATDRFHFEGFLPARSEARRKRLEQLAHREVTVILFESGHRIEASLAEMAKAFSPGRKAVVCRELTKQFETVLRGSLADLCETVARDSDQRRGEFVVLIEAAESPPDAGAGAELATALLEYLPASQAARVAARVSGGSRREIYAALGSNASKRDQD